MFRITTRHPACGPAADQCQGLPPGVGAPPQLVLLSASPGLLAARSGERRYFASHPRLGYELLAALRFVAARVLGAPDCQEHNRKLLEACGLTLAEIDALPDVGDAFFETEAALLAFAQAALARPDSVEDSDLDALRGFGWDDATILDALAHAASVQTPALLLRALRRRPGY